MKKKIIAAGHICLDITPVFSADRSYSEISEALNPGSLIHVKNADVHTGGSVANTGLALKILGVDVTLMGKIGNDVFGSVVQQIVSRYGGGGLIVDDQASTSYTIVLAVPGIDRIFLHDPGANDSFCSRDIPEKELENASLFHFGYPPLMKSIYENDGNELVTIFRRMKEKGIATSLDLASMDPDSDAGKVNWPGVLERVLPYVDFFVPSFDELCYILDPEKLRQLRSQGGDVTDDLSFEADVKPLADRLIQIGCRVVLIKCGTSGMYFQTAGRESLKEVGSRLGLDVDLWADRSGTQPVFPAEKVLSATGAGDTSIAAFLAGVLQGEPPEMCAALAAAEGSCCVTAYDALSGLKSFDELKSMIEQAWENKKEAAPGQHGVICK